MEVVKLPNRGDPRFDHLTIDRTRLSEVLVGILSVCEAIHLSPPDPEVTASVLGHSTQLSLESMAVSVGEPRDREAGQPGCARRWRRVTHHRLDPSVLDLDQDIAGHSTEPRALGVPETGAVQPLMGMRTPRSRATSCARAYPASACRMTPVPGSLVSTRSSFRAAASVPSATTTMPAWMERPIPTPPPW